MHNNKTHIPIFGIVVKNKNYQLEIWFLKLNFDGAGKGNPRPMGEGMVIHYPLGSFIKIGS